jgi:hypothetical protein
MVRKSGNGKGNYGMGKEIRGDLENEEYTKGW